MLAVDLLLGVFSSDAVVVEIHVALGGSVARITFFMSVGYLLGEFGPVLLGKEVAPQDVPIRILWHCRILRGGRFCRRLCIVLDS